MKKIASLFFLVLFFFGCSKKITSDHDFYEKWEQLRKAPSSETCWNMLTAVSEYNSNTLIASYSLYTKCKESLLAINNDCIYIHALLNKNTPPTDPAISNLLEHIDEHVVYITQIKNLSLQKTNDRLFKYFFILTFTILVFCVSFIILNNHELKKRDLKISQSADILDYVISAQEAERKRISRELHDSVAQDLHLISNMASKIENKDLGSEITKLQKKCIGEIRSICQNLLPPDLGENDLTETIRILCQKTLEKTDAELRLVITEDIDFTCFTEEQQTNIYRIIQESLQNILKHAEASEITVLIKNDSSVNGEGKSIPHLKIIISDDGKGINHALLSQINNKKISIVSKNHFGIRNIKERTNLLGGTVHFKSIEGMGTEIFIKLPLTTK